jgi:RNA-directed DNA polymerase
MEGGRFAPTEEGTPQGGVISPLLLNVALDGMEGAAGVRYQSSASNAGALEADSPALVRYADDFVVLCHSREEAEAAKARLSAWLAQRGLAFNEDKTRIVHLDEGFDFLGFHVQRRKDKLLITPSKASLVRVRARIATELRSLRGAPALVVIQRLNPIIRGWSSYYRGVVASEAFASLDTHLWRHTYKWAQRSHRNKSRHWVVAQYYGMFNPAHPNRWVFGDRKSGAYLVQFSWTRIVRHHLVKGRFSPDDPTLVEYWSRRRRRRPPPLSGPSLRLLRGQEGLCAVCATPLFDAEGDLDSATAWEQGSITEMVTRQRVTGPPGEAATFRLVHPGCSRRSSVASTPEPAPQLYAIGTA